MLAKIPVIGFLICLICGAVLSFGLHWIYSIGKQHEGWIALVVGMLYYFVNPIALIAISAAASWIMAGAPIFSQFSFFTKALVFIASLALCFGIFIAIQTCLGVFFFGK